MSDHQIIFVMALVASTIITLMIAAVDFWSKPYYQKGLTYNYLTIFGIFMVVFYIPNALFYWATTRGI